MIGKRTVFNVIAAVCLLAPLLVAMLVFMFGCASGTAKGGDTQMERSTEKPSTRTYRYESFGRDPTPAEIAAFAGWTAPKPEVKK